MMKFALCFSNRGTFPSEIIDSSRREMSEALKKYGYDYLVIDDGETRYGAVNGRKEGEIFALFLKKHEGEYDGVIMSLPNFGDENGAAVALKDCKTPILIHAFPDRDGSMGITKRRDSFCGKVGMMSVLRQCGIKYSFFRPFTVSPSSEAFRKQLDKFASVCRIVNGLKNINIGAIGARNTPFKTVRYDEIALQKNGINVETFDLSDFFQKADQINENRLADRIEDFRNEFTVNGTSDSVLKRMARVSLAFTDLIEEYKLGAVAVRCWNEFEELYHIAPCAVMSEMGSRGITAACECDITGALCMKMFDLASAGGSMLLDLNNNFEDDENKCIVFHCGVTPSHFLTEKGRLVSHAILEKSFGKENSYGVNYGRLGTYGVTYGSMKTENGNIEMYLGNGEFIDDKIDNDFFGTAGVFKNARLPEMLEYVGRNGYRHHTVFLCGDFMESIYDAATNYLGFSVHLIGGEYDRNNK